MHGPGEAASIDDRTPIKRAIEKKAAKYGDMGKAFLIAVNASSSTVDKIDIMEALFGREQFILHPNMGPDDEPVMRRDLDGAWVRPDGPKNTRVSAVIVGSCILPWTVVANVPVVYHNPWAQMPCTEILRELPSAVPDGGQMPTKDGTASQPFFGLPHGWPVGLD